MKVNPYTMDMAEEDLNELEPPEDMKQINGGPVPADAQWGTWLRQNNEVEFEAQWKELAAEDKLYTDSMLGE